MPPPLQRQLKYVTVTSKSTKITDIASKALSITIDEQPLIAPPLAPLHRSTYPSDNSPILVKHRESILPFIPYLHPTVSPSKTRERTSKPGVILKATEIRTGGSPTANCEGPGNACIGDVTYWAGDLAACGWDVDANSDWAIALPHDFMGTESNDNPYCGRQIILYNPNTGTTVGAAVKDKCVGCEARVIVCAEELFNAVTEGKGDGRYHDIVWRFSWTMVVDGDENGKKIWKTHKTEHAAWQTLDSGPDTLGLADDMMASAELSQVNQIRLQHLLCCKENSTPIVSQNR